MAKLIVSIQPEDSEDKLIFDVPLPQKHLDIIKDSTKLIPILSRIIKRTLDKSEYKEE